MFGRPFRSVGRNRRVTARVDDVAAGVVQRQRQAEIFPDFDLRDALQNLLRGYQIEPTKLIVGAEIAPGGTLRTANPARIVGHRHFLSSPTGRQRTRERTYFNFRTPIVRPRSGVTWHRHERVKEYREVPSPNRQLRTQPPGM
jgi:hypothetical protein